MYHDIQQLIDDHRFQHWLAERLLVNPEVRQDFRITPLVSGNQASLFRWQSDSVDIVLKCCFRKNWTGWLQRRCIHREAQVYERLQGLPGIANSYGLFAERVLVLDHIAGTGYRHAQFENREYWFKRFDQLLQAMHRHGVSHGDLKRKANILVGEDQQPWLLDFGISVIYREGWHPLNNWLFNYQKKTDINAFLKHKYHGDYNNIPCADRQRLQYTLPERLWRFLRPILGIK